MLNSNINKMLKRLSFRNTFALLPKGYQLNQGSQFSNISITDNNGKCEALDADQHLENSSQHSYKTKEVSQLLNEAATFKDVNNKDWMTTPYCKDIPLNKKEETQLKINPENTSILLFPGQGTIKVGMIKKYMQYPGVMELFDIANEITGYNLLKLCLYGPQEKLNKTEFNQAATVVSSLVALEKIKAESSKVFETCVAAAGYSVGEISSLIFSSAISFEDGIRLVWTRGKAMQLAADKVPQGMLSVLNTPREKVTKACTEAEKWAMDMGIENPICRIAIFLCTDSKILAGHMEALEYIKEHKTQLGLNKVSRVPVSGAFHTPLMNPAVKPVFKLLNSIEINEPRCQVYSNYMGAPYKNFKYMKKYILKQMVSPVKWEQCLQSIYQRPEGTPFPQTYDIGSEGRMKTILKLVNLKACRSCTII
ncbi:malonyl-CoA-acyl carrier protein transacylase beg [Xylocopa sonorina]|uniref:malonyl-CoA-acyl carrier protein transacylase beg n=1 Tax=Xylocopa sonorina TaxID=1818115 RepID=UPI00403AC7D0